MPLTASDFNRTLAQNGYRCVSVNFNNIKGEVSFRIDTKPAILSLQQKEFFDKIRLINNKKILKFLIEAITPSKLDSNPEYQEKVLTYTYKDEKAYKCILNVRNFGARYHAVVNDIKYFIE